MLELGGLEMYSRSDMAKYLDDVKAKYPECDCDEDVLVRFFARAIVHLYIENHDEEEMTFHCVLDIVSEESVKDIAADKPPKIVRAVLARWPEISRDENKRKLIIANCGQFRTNVNGFTKAWCISPFEQSSTAANHPKPNGG
jgi:hypothetical protein